MRYLAVVRVLTAMAFSALVNEIRGEEVDFLRDVRPILSSHCFKCHGPDEGTRKGGLRLDLREEATKPAKSGKRAIVPGESEKSELLARVLTEDEDDLMPPPAAKHPLNSQQKEILKRWIASGAEYKPHWAFVAPKKPALPEVKDVGWPRNEIDRFILAALEKRGLKPSPEADRYTLARRLHLDLIGLPPRPEEVDAFVKDESGDAYERLVDSLLASPHYGERWARKWLDLARYADTNGYEKDRPRSIWPYRDWVIHALNADMPFDQFTIEQIAGDMLPEATVQQKVATGFHRNTMINEEGGIDPLEYRFYAMVDRVHVTATTWLGLTMACAQCHTHKYDPIQHTEYFQFMAYMNNADEPVMEVPDPKVTERRRELQARIDQLESTLADRFPVPPAIQWLTPAEMEFTSQNGATGELLTDGSFRVTGTNPEKDIYTLEFRGLSQRITHLQIEAIPDEQVVKGGPGRTDHGNFVLSEIEFEVREGSAERRVIKFASSEADHAQQGFPSANAHDGKAETGWAVGTTADKRLHRRIILKLAEPLKMDPQKEVTLRLKQEYGGRHTLGRFRVSLGSDVGTTIAREGRAKEHLDKKFRQWLEAEAKKVVQWERLRPMEAKSDTPVLTIEPEDVIFATGDFTKSDTYRIRLTGLPKGTRALRIEAMADPRLPQGGPGTVAYEGPEGDFFLSNLKGRAEGRELKFVSANQSFANGGNTADKAIDDDLQSGWSINGGQGRNHNAVFILAEPIGAGGELELEITCERYYAAGLGKFRVWATTEQEAQASGLSERAYTVLLKHPGSLEKIVKSAPTDQERQILLGEYVKVAPELATQRQEIDQLRAQMPKHPTTLVMQERHPGFTRKTYRHHRGEFLEPKEEVEPALPAIFNDGRSAPPRNRLEFARWLVSRENPLTGRVIMNRQWGAIFGRGLVRTSEDFGFQGELPSHPELLDWLAVEFMERGWSLKTMHKLLVMSATYQQASAVDAERMEKDPLNVWLSRGPRFRVESELVRDTALVVSGLLAPKLGGPSVYPPQPAGVTTEGAYGQLQWKVSEGADRYRRGLYTYAKRTTPFAMTLTFDGPSGEACLPRRDRSNTPLQALTLLNDEVFTESARALGGWAAGFQESEEETLVRVFRRCLSRPPNPAERQKLLSFYRAQLERFSRGELNLKEFLGREGKPEEAAWTTVARILLNLDETITKS